MDLRPDQLRRYGRQIILAEVGGAGQLRLLAASVRVTRADAVGAAAIVYLAAAGVGRIVLADAGVVAAADVGVLYEAADVGKPRLDAARERIAGLNPDVSVVADGEGRALDLPAATGFAALAAGARAAGAILLELAS